MDRSNRRFRRAARKSLKHSCLGEYYANCARLDEIMGSQEAFEKDAADFIAHIEDLAIHSSDYPPERPHRLDEDE